MPLDVPAVKLCANLFDSWAAERLSHVCLVQNADLADVREDGCCSAEERTPANMRDVLASADVDLLKQNSIHPGEVRRSAFGFSTTPSLCLVSACNLFAFVPESI
jgi:hypothetical protein